MDIPDIKAAILENRVVMFLGHSLTVNYGNLNRERDYFQQLSEESKRDISAYNAEDNFLIFTSKSAKNKIRRKAKPFYEQDFSSETLFKLSQIPLHTFVCLAPDMTLVNTFKNQNFLHTHSHWKNTPLNKTDFTAENPLIYHIFGCTEDPESLIISHYDLFDYIKHVHADGNQLQKVFADVLDKDQYDYILFLGCDFDKWYFQLVLNLLNIGFEYDAYEALALSTEGAKHQWQNVYEQYFKVEFIEENQIDDFVKELHAEFESDELRKPTEEIIVKKYHKNNIYSLLFDGFDDTNIRLMCQLDPDFEVVYKNFASGQEKSERIEHIISYAERYLLLGKLLRLAEEQNPPMYQQHQPYYDE